MLGEGVAIAAAIEQAGAGIGVRPEAPAVTQALEHILGADPALSRVMGQRAKVLAETEFSTAAMAQRLISLYEEVRGVQQPEARTGSGALAPPQTSPEAR